MTAPIYKEFTLQACDTQISIAGTNRETDPDFFASNVTGASWTLTATETTDGMGHQVCIRNDAATDHSAKTITINGFYGHFPVSETINLPAGNATVKTSKFYTKVTSPLVPSATIGADTMDIGIVEICRTPIIKGNWRGRNAGYNISFDNETAIDYTLRFTRSKVEPDTNYHRTNVYTGIYDTLRWFDFGDPDLVNATSDTITNDQEVGTAIAVLINSYTQSTTPKMYIEITQQSIN